MVSIIKGIIYIYIFNSTDRKLDYQLTWKISMLVTIRIILRIHGPGDISSICRPIYLFYKGKTRSL